MSRYYSVRELVALGIVVSNWAAYRAVKIGDLPAPIRLAGKMRWNADDLNAFLRGRAGK